MALHTVWHIMWGGPNRMGGMNILTSRICLGCICSARWLRTPSAEDPEKGWETPPRTQPPSSSLSVQPITIAQTSLLEYFSFLCCQPSGIIDSTECCLPLFTSWIHGQEGEKASTYAFWHINSSQRKERRINGSKLEIKTGCSDKVQITERSRHK